MDILVLTEGGVFRLLRSGGILYWSLTLWPLSTTIVVLNRSKKRFISHPHHPQEVIMTQFSLYMWPKAHVLLHAARWGQYLLSWLEQTSNNIWYLADNAHIDRLSNCTTWFFMKYLSKKWNTFSMGKFEKKLWITVPHMRLLRDHQKAGHHVR